MDPVSHQENKGKDKRIYEEVNKRQYEGKNKSHMQGACKTSGQLNQKEKLSRTKKAGRYIYI